MFIGLVRLSFVFIPKSVKIMSLLTFTSLFPVLKNWNKSLRFPVICFPPALASRFLADHFPKVPFTRLFRTGCYISTTVTSCFPAVPLLFRAGPVVFRLLTGFCFVLIIADDFLASILSDKSDWQATSSLRSIFISALASRFSD